MVIRDKVVPGMNVTLLSLKAGNRIVSALHDHDSDSALAVT